MKTFDEGDRILFADDTDYAGVDDPWTEAVVIEDVGDNYYRLQYYEEGRDYTISRSSVYMIHVLTESDVDKLVAL